jgi:hypothetical protein
MKLKNGLGGNWDKLIHISVKFFLIAALKSLLVILAYTWKQAWFIFKAQVAF